MLVKETRVVSQSAKPQQKIMPAVVSGKEIATTEVRKSFVLFFENKDKKIFINSMGLNILSNILQKSGYAVPATNHSHKECVGISNSCFTFLKMFLQSKEIELQVTVRPDMYSNHLIDNIKLNPTQDIHPKSVLKGKLLLELTAWANYFGHVIKDDHIEYSVYKTKDIVMACPVSGPFIVNTDVVSTKKLFYNFFSKGGKISLQCSNRVSGISIDLKHELKCFNYLNNRFQSNLF